MRSAIKTILLSGFIAGSLDILAAFFIYSAVLKKTTPVKILESVASGVFKARAYSGEPAMPIYGLIFHFCIALSFAAAYFFIFPHIVFLKKQKIISGILYGIFVWVIMNIVVLPVVVNKMPTITISPFLIAISILIVMVGLPISLITDHYYSLQSKNPG